MNRNASHRPLRRCAAFFTLILVLCFAILPVHAAQKSEPINILLIGADSHELDQRGRSDSMLLLRIFPDEGQVKVLSFMRDMYLPIPGFGKNRLNAAYAFGGEELLKSTICNNFDITIDRTIAVSFDLLAKVIDEMGGVTITLSKDEVWALNKLLTYYNAETDPSANSEPVSTAGTQVLNGAQALCYSRVRFIDSDFQRVVRQQTVLRAMLDRLREMDLLTLTKMALDCLSQVRTDLSLQDITALLPLVSREDLSIETSRIPFDGLYQGASIDGMQVLIPDLPRNKQAAWDFLGE